MPRHFTQGPPRNTNTRVSAAAHRLAGAAHQILERHLPEGSGWREWNNLWTAEEDRHGQVLHDYARDTRLLKQRRLEEMQFEYLRAGFHPQWDRDPYRVFATNAFALLGLRALGRALQPRQAHRRLAGAPGLVAAVATADPGALPIGELRLEAMVPGRDTIRAPLLISFSEQWVIANFDEVLNLLRHFGYDERIRALRSAPPAERPELWRSFWRDTDPNPATPENEI